VLLGVRRIVQPQQLALTGAQRGDGEPIVLIAAWRAKLRLARSWYPGFCGSNVVIR
jgi:hypothetical protein